MNTKKMLLGTCVILIGVFLYFGRSKSEASHVHYQITASSETVQKGNEVAVSFSVLGEDALNSVDAYVYYDDTILEFISADKDVFTGTSGVLKLTDRFDEEVKEISYQLTFRALEVGTAPIKVQEMFVEEEDAGISTVDNEVTTITVKENMSESVDATLDSLEVFPETLTPEFTKNVAVYHMTVDSDTDEIIMSAIPSDDESVVKVMGNENLKRGDNTVTIEVTSKSGVTKEYKIIVNKQ